MRAKVAPVSKQASNILPYAASEYSPEDLSVRRLEALTSDRAVLAKDAYFDGGDVLACHAGRFRFAFKDSGDTIELMPGEILVIYPGNTVTISATANGSRLKYVIFSGTRVSDFFDSFGFYDRLHFSGDTQQETFDQAVRLSATDIRQTLSYLIDALTTFAHNLHTGEQSRLHEIRQAIDRNVRIGQPRLKTICSDLGISRATLNRLFAANGLGSPSDYIHRLQYQRAVRLLKTTSLPIADIGRAVGISAPTYFTEFIQRMAGCSPTKLRHRSSAN